MRVTDSPDVVDRVTKITEEESVRIRGKRRPFNDFESHLNEFSRPRNEEVRNKTDRCRCQSAFWEAKKI